MINDDNYWLIMINDDNYWLIMINDDNYWLIMINDDNGSRFLFLFSPTRIIQTGPHAFLQNHLVEVTQICGGILV
jgi:hypothetical protein